MSCIPASCGRHRKDCSTHKVEPQQEAQYPNLPWEHHILPRSKITNSFFIIPRLSKHQECQGDVDTGALLGSIRGERVDRFHSLHPSHPITS